MLLVLIPELQPWVRDHMVHGTWNDTGGSG